MLHKAKMLEEIKAYYGFATDAEFAAHLDIKPQVLSNWKARNTFDAELLFHRCRELNPAWLLGREGRMLAKPVLGEVREENAAYLLQKEITHIEKQLRLLQESFQTLTQSEAFYKKTMKTMEQQLAKKKKLLKGQ